MLINNMTYFWLIWIVIGVALIIVAVFMLSHIKIEAYEKKEKLKEFNSLLEKKTIKHTVKPDINKAQISMKIIEMSENGKNQKQIAELLGIGIGEVELILSLYKKGGNNNAL